MKCRPGWFLTTKVPGSIDPVDQICGKCDKICRTCEDTAENCSSCFPGSYKDATKCDPCHGNCKSCDGTAGKCTACWTNPELALAGIGDPRDWIGNGENEVWRGVDLYMISDGMTLQQGLDGRLIPGTPFENPDLTNGWRCKLKCADGWWHKYNTGITGNDWYDQSCHPCSLNCKTCVETADNCTSCWAKADVESLTFEAAHIYSTTDTIKFRKTSEPFTKIQI